MYNYPLKNTDDYISQNLLNFANQNKSSDAFF